MSNPRNHFYEFGPFRLDLVNRLLLRDGEVVPLKKKAFETLRVLVESRATARDLKDARIHSWEHGLIRETQLPSVPWKGRFLVARGEADAPDIDGRVYVRGELPVGEFAQVKVIGATDYDLVAIPG